MEDNVLGYECKHAIWCPAVGDNPNDLTLVKENIHYKDGTIKPNVRLIKNNKRDFYITKREFRNHSDKKEYEDVKYSLCSISFNPENGTFGDHIDTLVSAKKINKSISFIVFALKHNIWDIFC